MGAKSILLLALALASGGWALAEALPEIQPTPAEHEAAVDEAERVGRAVFMRFYMQRRAAGVLAEAGIEDPRVEGSILSMEGTGLMVSFVGVEGGRLVSLHDVRFDDPDLGKLVSGSVSRKLQPNERWLHEVKQAAIAALPMRCAETYEAILGPSPQAAQTGGDIYLIPVPESPGEVAIGGHARVRIGLDGKTVLEAEPLSKSCLNVQGPDDGEIEGLATSHLLSTTPISTHVFLSLLHEKPVIVVTDAGSWLVVAGAISYLGATPDEPCCEGILDDESGPPTGLPLRSGYEPKAEDPAQAPSWRRRLIVWRDTDDPETPWRHDERMSGLFPDGYPDDVSVIFPPNPGESRAELMWVRILAHDPDSDLYLAVLLNQPMWVNGVGQGDNVVFGYDPDIGRMLARSLEGDYPALGLPAGARDGYKGAIYESVVHLRRSQNPTGEAEISACIATLSGLMADLGPEVSPSDRYLAHYTLGRCLAELYETEKAIEQYKKARELRPQALDPQLALLAEYSVKMHGAPESGHWEQTYLEQLELVRGRFGENEMVTKLMATIFDENYAGDLDELSPQEIERRRRVGFGVFRWKLP